MGHYRYTSTSDAGRLRLYLQHYYKCYYPSYWSQEEVFIYETFVDRIYKQLNSQSKCFKNRIFVEKLFANQNSKNYVQRIIESSGLELQAIRVYQNNLLSLLHFVKQEQTY